MKHNFLTEKQISEIEERLKSMQKLMMMDIDSLLKEVRGYRGLFGDIDDKKIDSTDRKKIDIPQVDVDILKDYPEALKPKDIQRILGIGISQTYELLNSGEFHVVRIGRSYRISKRIFLHWLKGQE
ncbi:helix-turn-helix domain-containing protein [Brevibacillus sp. B_LB10_24]|uniref:helix-turn-helix domain-containing protein n=1 Tax=Brevibacillus sp. B_LB10_24 TaxID=3380645 RepID=UPI0038BD5979